MLSLFLCHFPSSTLNQLTHLVCSVVLTFDIPWAYLWLQIGFQSAFHSIVPLLIKLWYLDHNPLAWGLFEITLFFFMARNRPWTISTKQNKNNRLGDIIVPDTIVGKSPCQQIKLAFTHHLKWDTLVDQTVKCLPTMWETRVQSLVWEDLLEKEMASHSSILTWKVPWTEEPGRL